MNNIDKHDRLKSNPFSYQSTKNGKVIIHYEGRQIMILTEKDSKKLLNRVSGKDDFGVQLELAKVTGNFKRGNERRK
jgi:hypothetical protein